MAATETFFQQFTQPRPVSRYREINGTCRWEIADAGSWLLELNRGLLTASKDAERHADCTIICNQHDFDLLVQRKLNPFTTFLQGRVVVDGNLGLAQLCIRLFTRRFEPVPQQEKGVRP